MVIDDKRATLIFKAGIMKDQSNFLLWEGNSPPRKGQAADGNHVLTWEWCSHCQSWLSLPKIKERQPTSNGCKVGTQLVKNNTGGMTVSNLLSSREDMLNGSVVIPEGFNMDFNRWIRWYNREYIYIICRWHQSASTWDNRLQIQNDGFQKWSGINKLKFNQQSARKQSEGEIKYTNECKLHRQQCFGRVLWAAYEIQGNSINTAGKGQASSGGAVRGGTWTGDGLWMFWFICPWWRLSRNGMPSLGKNNF